MTKFYSATTGGFYDKQVHRHVIVVPDPEAVCPKVQVPDMDALPPDGDLDASWERPTIEIDDPNWIPDQIEVPNPNTLVPDDAVEISNDLHAHLLAQESDHGKIIRAGEGGLPIAVDPDPEPLDVSIANALKSVDSAAETARGAFITPGAGQTMTYQAKEAEADAILQDANPDPAFYPMLAACIGIDGGTLEAVAETIRAKRDAWLVIGAEIEKRRLTAKAAIKDATTHEDIQTILDGLTWPQPEA